MKSTVEKHLETRQRRERPMIARAVVDADFRARLLADPTGTLKDEYGLEIPGDGNIRVVAEEPNTHYFLLPPAQSPDLTEEDLEAVAGGWYVHLFSSSICFGSGEAPEGGCCC